jgi:hypothetical protein
MTEAERRLERRIERGLGQRGDLVPDTLGDVPGNGIGSLLWAAPELRTGTYHRDTSCFIPYSSRPRRSCAQCIMFP